MPIWATYLIGGGVGVAPGLAVAIYFALRESRAREDARKGWDAAASENRGRVMAEFDRDRALMREEKATLDKVRLDRTAAILRGQLQDALEREALAKVSNLAVPDPHRAVTVVDELLEKTVPSLPALSRSAAGSQPEPPTTVRPRKG